MDARADLIGYVNFIRGTNVGSTAISPSELNFNNFRQEVLHKQTIDVVRQYTYGMESETSVVDEELKSVVWSDGAISQLNTICDEEQLQMELNKKIISCKQSASRTAVEQACDVCPYFRSRNKVQKSVTAKDLPPTGGLKYKLESVLKKQEEAGILNLSYKHKKAIVDFISCAPGISAKAAPTPYTISQGFKLNGMVDENTGCYPDFYKMIGTVRRKISQDEM
jgi:hypothetical protein